MSKSVPADPLGRIPFRVRIGVAGHRELQHEEQLAVAVREQVRAIWDGQLGLPGSSTTPIELAVISPLAKGADRMVVREVLDEARSRDREARLEVILPMERDAYAVDQGFTGPVLIEYHELLGRATAITELPEGKAEGRYKRAGHAVVESCDVLLALWSGEPSGGEGGTAETLLYAAARWRPCIWISTAEGHRVRHNLEPGTAGDFLEEVRRRAGVDDRRVQIGEPQESEPERVLKTLVETLRWVRRFNEEPMNGDLSARLGQELTPHVDLRWVAAPYLRATLAADRYQKWFTRTTWTMAGLATLIATTVAFELGFELGPVEVGSWIELGLIAVLVTVFLYTHSRIQLHERWLSYRLLAERLRSARYLAATGVSFPRATGLRALFVEEQSANWVQRAFEEVWDSRPTAGRAHRITDEEADTLKTWLADDWILSQINYHRKAANTHRQRERLFARVTLGLFALTLVAVLARAIPDTLGTAPESLGHVSVFFSIVLPAAGASLGAILTVRQHRALGERFHRMQAELTEVRERVLEADKDSLQRVSSDAARVIAEEGGDWFGAMWFLDIEHPP